MTTTAPSGHDERALGRRAVLFLVHEVEENARRRQDHARREDGPPPHADALVDARAAAHEDLVLEDDRDGADRLEDAADLRGRREVDASSRSARTSRRGRGCRSSSPRRRTRRRSRRPAASRRRPSRGRRRAGARSRPGRRARLRASGRRGGSVSRSRKRSGPASLGSSTPSRKAARIPSFTAAFASPVAVRVGRGRADLAALRAPRGARRPRRASRGRLLDGLARGVEEARRPSAPPPSASWCAGESGTSGRRSAPPTRPSRSSAHFTGIGFDSRKFAFMSGKSLAWSAAARVAVSREGRRDHLDEEGRAPRSRRRRSRRPPPHAIIGSASESSPERTAKPAGRARRISQAWSRLPEASLTAAMRGSSRELEDGLGQHVEARPARHVVERRPGARPRRRRP